jgi:penicillin-binding protein 1A
VRTSSGRVVYERPAMAARIVLAERHAGAISDMLNAALISGTGKRAALPLHPASGKTGTTQEYRDAWFIGYTAHLVGGVWVGNDDRHPMNRVMGGNLPARLWHAVMMLAHEGRTPTALPGTMPTAPLAPAAANTKPADQATAPPPPMDPAFLERALGDEGGWETTITPAPGKPAARSSWMDRATGKIRRLITGVPG